jgi:hypothetical protein
MLQKTDDKCRFNIPYWPMDTTRILIPMTSDDGCRAGYKKKISKMRSYLELKMYDIMRAFWEDHNIKDLEEYLIINASISRPSVMIRRQMTAVDKHLPPMDCRHPQFKHGPAIYSQGILLRCVRGGVC